MSIAEKILSLRKNNQWSQEELAARLNVSRQSISKWEGSAAIPDVDKILEMSNLFGVTTDYLLKDDAEAPEPSAENESQNRVLVSQQEAGEFLEHKARQARQIAIGVAVCILSPIFLILLGGLYETGGLSETVATGGGVVALLVLIAAAVAMFILSSARMKRFQYLETVDFALASSVADIVRQGAAAFEKTYLFRIITGIALTILSPLPLILASLMNVQYMVIIECTALLLVAIAVGVSLIVTGAMVKGGYDQLLRTGEYEPAIKEKNRIIERIGGIYWPLVVAVYLGWSLFSHRWGLTWIVWPIAALVFTGISAALGGWRDR
jgi:transcriptional regulator with XRE-family HTH domain